MRQAHYKRLICNKETKPVIRIGHLGSLGTAMWVLIQLLKLTYPKYEKKYREKSYIKSKFNPFQPLTEKPLLQAEFNIYIYIYLHAVKFFRVFSLPNFMCIIGWTRFPFLNTNCLQTGEQLRSVPKISRCFLTFATHFYMHSADQCQSASYLRISRVLWW